MNRIVTIVIALVAIAARASAAEAQDKNEVLLIAREGSSHDLELMLTKEVGVMMSMLEEAGFEVVVASGSAQPLVAQTTTLQPDLKLADVDVSDYVGVIVPCLALGYSGSPATTVEMVRQAVSEGTPVAAQRSAVLTFARAGVLAGRQYASWEDHSPEGDFVGLGVVQDGIIITSGVCPYAARAYGGRDGTPELTQKLIDALVLLGPEGMPKAVSSTTTLGIAWVDQPVPLQVTVQLEAPLEATRSLREMMLDLSALPFLSDLPEGQTDLPLAHMGDGRYTLGATITPVRNGHYNLPVQLATPEGERISLLRVPLTVWPAVGLDILDDGLGFAGELSSRNVERLDPSQSEVVFAGSAACAVEGEEGFWRVGFPFPPTGGLGYRALRFAFHPGETAFSGGERFSVAVAPGKRVNLLKDGWVDMARQEWQVVEIPLGLFETDEPYYGVNFSGTLAGLFYLDAVELVLRPDDAEDLVILGEGLDPGWELDSRSVDRLDPAQTRVAHSGETACAVQGQEGTVVWSVTFQTTGTVCDFDYETLRFAFHPGETTFADGERFTVTVAGKRVHLSADSWVDMAQREWQVVEIPLTDFALDEPLESVKFVGTFDGVFYLDDLALGAVRPPARSPTAVLEEHTDPLPQAFTLQQNYPNPFNSDTAIGFALPTAAEAELALFNLAGQRVATLAQGRRQAGAHTVRWDGRDDHGHALASGVYLYRLQVGQRQVETRKLLLLR